MEVNVDAPPLKKYLCNVHYIKSFATLNDKTYFFYKEENPLKPNFIGGRRSHG